MTTFISYQPGAKGKFIAEICDLGILPNSYYTHPLSDIHGGNVRWLEMPMIKYLNEHDLPQGTYHGIYPEEDVNNYTRYIDTIIEALQTLNSKYTVDTHYVERPALEYILSKGAKVVRIINTDSESARKMQDNFFFKNFLNKNKAGVDNIVRHVMTLFDTPIKKDFNYNLLDKPLKEWDKDSLRILYDVSGISTKKLQEPNIIVHENLLEVKSNDLTSIDTLTKIIEFAGGTMNDVVKTRIEQYNNSQLEISTFEEYIEDFLNNK